MAEQKTKILTGDVSLKKTLGTMSIVMMVVAAAAPLTVVAGTVPLVVAMAGNIGAPAYYLTAAIILGVFAVGFTAMSAHVPNAGAFYSYVQAGLGRTMGMGSAIMAVVAYFLLEVAVYAYVGQATANVIANYTGMEIPWYLYTAIWWAFIAFLGYRNIDLSSNVLGIFLFCEVAVLVILDIAIVAKGGAMGLDLTPFLPTNYISGAPGVGLMFAFFGFIGFEATAVFRNEAKDPDKTIPRATYIAVAFIGGFYAISSWCLIMGAGSESALGMALADPDNFALYLANDYVGVVLFNTIQALLVSSLFACCLSFHNVCSRYLFTLSGAGVFPGRLAEIHPTHSSPHKASFVTSAVAAILIVVVALLGLDPISQVYAWFSGGSTFGLMLLQLLTSVSVITFFKTHASTKGKWNTLVAPIIATIGLGAVTVLILVNFPMLTGDTTSAMIMGSIVPLSFVIGTLLARNMKKRQPAQFENLKLLIAYDMDMTA